MAASSQGAPETRVEFGERPQCGCHAREHDVGRAILVFVELLSGAACALKQPLVIGEAAVLGAQFREFVWFQVERGEFLQLETQQLETGVAVPCRRFELQQSVEQRKPDTMRGLHLTCERLQPPVRVQQFALRGGPDQRLEFVLAMDVDQFAHDLAEHLHRYLLTVEPRTRTTVARKAATHDQLFGRVVDRLLFEALAQAAWGGTNVESGDYFGALGITADEIGAAAPAGDQAERVDDDRLARPGLAGEHGEARAEFDVQCIDDGEVADAEMDEHDQRSCS
jgi:hypothetical protein